MWYSVESAPGRTRVHLSCGRDRVQGCHTGNPWMLKQPRYAPFQNGREADPNLRGKEFEL